MRLFFCPNCRFPAIAIENCPKCGSLCNAEADTYTEKLMVTILSEDPSRVGMAIDVLTKWMYEPRVLIPLQALLQNSTDAHSLVMAARGLGYLANQEAVSGLIACLQNFKHPFVARIAAAQALGRLGGARARDALRKVLSDPRTSVSNAALEALKQMDNGNGTRNHTKSKIFGSRNEIGL